ncbi:MAG: transcription elongation factor GreAB [Bacteroidetes bacterium]|nr:MAG: transcription elongation factor GreAB [Bacteroidota bacterium]
MNRAFVNEDDDAGVVLIPPRAPLPPGTTNYVTPRGLSLLKSELKELDTEKARITSARKIADQERVRLMTIARGRYNDLKSRISTAIVLDPASQPANEVRFGATVLLKGDTSRTLTIVGVDEANASDGRIAFVAPVARALVGKSVGAEVKMPSPSGPILFSIVEIKYENT